MDTRAVKSVSDKVENSYSYQFVHKLQELIIFASPLTANQNFFNRTDGLEEIRNKFSLLNKTLQSLIEVVAIEEDQRQEYSIPMEILEEVNEAEKELAEAKASLSKLKEDGEKRAAELELLESEISNDIEIQNSQASADIVKKAAEVNEERNKINDAKSDLKFKQGKLETKIDSACCGCGTKKYIKEKEVVDADIKSLEDKLKQLALDADNITGKSKRDELLAKQKKARAMLRKHRKNFPATLEAAKQRLAQAEIEMEAKNLLVDNKKQEFKGTISNQSMLMLLQAYLQFDAINQACDAEFIKKLSETSKRKANMSKLSDQITTVQTLLKQLLAKMWCPDSANRTGLMILDSFDKTTRDIISQSVAVSSELVEKYLPSAKEAKLAKKKSRVATVSASGLFAPTSSSSDPAKPAIANNSVTSGATL